MKTAFEMHAQLWQTSSAMQQVHIGSVHWLTEYALQKYTAFFPTLRNTNLNDIKSAAAIGGSVTDVGYYGQNTADGFSTPFDCEYAPAPTVTSSRCVTRRFCCMVLCFARSYCNCELGMIMHPCKT